MDRRRRAPPHEGEVYSRLLHKIEIARAALGGRVYDVLGRLFEACSLRDLLIEAIRYGERAEVKARLFQVVDDAVDRQHLLNLLANQAVLRGRPQTIGVCLHTGIVRGSNASR
jgi:hypothetical protein